MKKKFSLKTKINTKNKDIKVDYDLKKHDYRWAKA